MPILVKCPTCPATLSITEEALGKAVRCPKCRTILRPRQRPHEPEMMTAELLPLPGEGVGNDRVRTDESVMPRLVAESSVSSADSAPVQSLRKRKRKRRIRWLPRIAIGSVRWPTLLAVAGPLFLLVAAGVGVYLANRSLEPNRIPAEQWERVEVAGRFRALLPGPSQPTTSFSLGPSMQFHLVEPTSTSVFGVCLTTSELPAAREPLPDSRRLDDFCAALLRRMSRRGWKEVSREEFRVGPHECRQLVVTITDPRVAVPANRVRGGYLVRGREDGSMREAQTLWPAGGHGTVILRCYHAHNRVLIVLAGGREISPDHPDAQHLFDSFELLD